MFSERSDRPSVMVRGAREGEIDLSPRLSALEREPFGRAETRASVAGLLAERGASIDPERIVMVPSASAATLALLYVLADPGDEILVTAPRDPRLDELAAVSGVALAPVPLAVVDTRWVLDASALFEAAMERARAIVLASPGMPTGSLVADEVVDVLAELDLPVVCDESLARLAFAGTPRSIIAHPIFSSDRAPLTLVLDTGGDLGCFIAVGGPEDRAGPMLARLERVAMTFFARSPSREHLEGEAESIALARRNAEAIRDALKGTTALVPHVNGGLFACVRLPPTRTAAAWSTALAQRGVLVASGDAFDFSDGSWIVLALDVDTGDLYAALRVIAELVLRG